MAVCVGLPSLISAFFAEIFKSLAAAALLDEDDAPPAMAL